MGKTALITGINGQDGSYLAEFLLAKGYHVVGIVRRHSISENQTGRIEHLMDKISLEYGDLLDMSSLVYVIQQYQPDEIYHLAAQSHVRISFDQPIFTAEVTAMGTLNLLEAIRLIKPVAKVYNAGSSEMFGNNVDPDGKQRETTPMIPVSPYGCSKVFSYNICHNYRNAYNMHICTGILFNHESTRRGINFVTNKVAKGGVEIAKGLNKTLALGNLDASRDWSHAKDMVKAMWMMLQLEKPDDYVCASGISHNIRDLCEIVFTKLGLDYKDYVTLDNRFLRPEELHALTGDCSKFKKATGWKQEFTFEQMIHEMVDFWMERL